MKLSVQTKQILADAILEMYYAAQDRGIAVVGLFDGIGMSIPYSVKGVIYVHPGIKLEHSFFVFMHEIGHVFSLTEDLEFEKRTGAGTEKQANTTALKIIGCISVLSLKEKIRLAKAFVQTYNRVNAKAIAKKRRAPFREDPARIVTRWHKIIGELNEN